MKYLIGSFLMTLIVGTLFSSLFAWFQNIRLGLYLHKHNIERWREVNVLLGLPIFADANRLRYLFDDRDMNDPGVAKIKRLIKVGATGFVVSFLMVIGTFAILLAAGVTMR
jgi:hypothetical protein